MTSLSKAEKGKLLSGLSTFGIGGPARYFLEVHSIEEMQNALVSCFQEKIPYLVIGKGSNCLFDDRGFDGLVMLNKIHFCTFENESVHVGAGYSFSLIGVQTARKGWSGLEFASGIPGTVGGAVFMNAGANGHETCDCLIDVTYISESGELQTLPKEQLVFSYRSSSFQNRRGGIAAATFRLTLSPEARQKQLKIVDYRMHTQPYKDKSAGCVFRNPTQSAAGALIQQCGLKGLSIGGAQISSMHANFIVNMGNATAEHVLELAELVQRTVKEKTGIDLEMEIRRIPYQMG
ncbi:MAG TPA: UDP-N-acetylmuramate dehydrogenase [Rhabdochlamydiaceae bacterium]|nr:UDP-N-acetylmuramate dehydrogenase [Rhabdochlamydiaceae bacterium]